jgi:hypothetical protein
MAASNVDERRAMSDRVFEDRVGLWVVDPTRGVARAQAIRSFAGGLIRDVFLPRTSSSAHFGAIRKAGLNAHLWVAVDGRSSADFAAETLADIARLTPGAAELNVELGSDAGLAGYVDDVIHRIRAVRRNYRLRVNLGAWKGFATPAELLVDDPYLYVCEQAYLGNMDEVLSPADVLGDLLAYGAPAAKATVCYAAACTVLGSSSRLRTLPDLSRVHRGVIYQDDLMADAGLL